MIIISIGKREKHENVSGEIGKTAINFGKRFAIFVCT
jgi:hypothetical protein